MYAFCDVNKFPADADMLSAESVSFAGEWLEKVIPGFRVLGVSGRELMGAEIAEKAIESIDGASFQHRRYPSRTIKVRYQIKAPTDREYRERYNKLASKLKREQVQIIFADEPDKYFIGSVSETSDPEMGTNHAIGEFSIHCADPFKYSTTEKEFPLTGTGNTRTCQIINSGSVPVPIRWEIKLGDESGYLGIASSNGGAMEYGNRQEMDTGTNHITRDKWLIQSGDVIKSWPKENSYQHSLKLYSHGPAVKPRDMDPIGAWLGIGDESTAITGRNWCRGMKTFSVPADTSGHVGAKDFYCKTFHWFEAGAVGQCGEQVIQFMNGNTEICRLGISKNSANNTGMIYFSIAGKIRKEIQFECTTWEPLGGGNRGHEDVRKEGDKFRFYWNGAYYHFTEPTMANVECNKIQISFAHLNGVPAITRNLLGEFRFQKLHETYSQSYDIKNTFPPGALFVIDGDESKFYLNGMHKPQHEVRGTHYFKADPGTVQCQIIPSPWYTGSISGKAIIREAWL